MTQGLDGLQIRWEEEEEEEQVDDTVAMELKKKQSLHITWELVVEELSWC
jgi:hypothetical protein